jgi:hypothetical protein
MSVYRFTVPGHSTRREFAVYVVVARRPDTRDFFVYVGKTGDNRDGCNPVISRAGNHFSHNKVHSQVRNKIVDKDGEPHLYDYEYFYVTFNAYGISGESRKSSVDVVNEMERATNRELTRRLATSSTTRHLNEYKGIGYVPSAEREARRRLMTPDRLRLVTALVDSVMEYVASIEPRSSDQNTRIR